MLSLSKHSEVSFKEPLWTTVRIRAAHAAGNLRHVICDPFGLAWMALVIARAVEDAGVIEQYFFPRRDQNKLPRIRRLRIKSVRLIAHRRARAALQPVAVVVDDLFPRAAVNHRLVALDTGPFLAFVSRHGDRAKLDALDDLIRFGAELFDLHAVKLRVFEPAQEFFLLKRA